MRATLTSLSEADLLFLTDALAPASDRARMLRVLREDEEILEAMIANETLFRRVSSDVDIHLRISPRLFFTILLEQVRRDLRAHGYTLERSAGTQAVVFDGTQVQKLLDNAAIRDYLVELLVSFVKVRSTTVTVRVRKGIWRRYRISDFDLDGMLRYSQMIDEELRYPTYKRLADICLFLLGLYPEHVDAGTHPLGHSPRRGVRTRENYVEEGRKFYLAAAEHTEARITGDSEVLLTLAEHFILATKPLSVMAARYLGQLRESMFLQ